MIKKIYFIILLLFTTFAVQAQVKTAASKLNGLIYYLDNYYVDTLDVNKISNTIISETLRKLDPHSYFLSKEVIEKAREPLRGNFEGVGIRFSILRDTILVVSPISGGPSDKLGIISGDKIIYIEDSLVAGNGITNQDVIEFLRGEKGTQVNVKIKRAGVDELIKFTIMRDKIPLFSVDAAYMLDDSIGYLKINRFSATTFQEVKKAIQELKSEGMQGLIIDLTGNSGGYLQAAVNIIDEFLKDDKLIVYTKGVSSPRKNYHATSIGSFQEGRVVVMVNEGSASASEILAGAIQDTDRGLIVGRRTFGKGLVQKTFPLSDGSAIRLTTARYYTPSGRFIQSPYDEGTKQYYKNLYSRLEKGELTNPDSISFPDSLVYFTDNNRKVYGGGGIMPDFFVAIDTSFYSGFLLQLSKKNIFNSFSLTYADRNRERIISQYEDALSFKTNFKITGDLWYQFLEAAKEKDIDVDNATDVAKSEVFIKTRLKAQIAADLYGREAFFMIWNTQDPIFSKAYEIIKKNNYDKVAFF